MMNMKNKIILSVMTLGLITWSCSESPIGQQPIDSIAPGAVSNVNVIFPEGLFLVILYRMMKICFMLKPFIT